MPRILGVDIPNKRIEYALCYIYGIGLSRAQALVGSLGIDSNKRSSELSEEELNKIASLIVDNKWVVEGDLRRERTSNIKRLQAIKSYRGLRHYRGLPVRGQRTSTNARTRKGARKSVGGLNKK